MLIGIEDRRVITTKSPPLGLDPEAAFYHERCLIRPEETLVLVSSGILAALDSAGLRIGEAAIASLISRHFGDSATRLVARLKQLLNQAAPADDLTVLILKRRRRTV
jgi:serine phosphatase RsbU (regulator of sigma subunit)